MPSCIINFQNSNKAIFYSGQSVSGLIQLNNDKKRFIQGVTLIIEGYALCKWTENEGSGKNRRTVHYSGREDYINSFSYLVGSCETTNTKLDFAAGVHQFNFSFHLPPQLPTSLESKYGHIRYQIRVEIKRQWKTDFKYCFGFTVIKKIDLNNCGISTIREPLKVEKSKQFFFGLSSKALHISAEIPLTGFVSGQQIPIHVNVNNDSNVEVTEILAELVKTIHYNSDIPRRKIRERFERVVKASCVGVASKNKSCFNVALLIPSIEPTNIGTCRVISLMYEIHVVAKVGAFHRDVVLKMPIVIGTVPFFSSQTNQFYHNQQYTSTFATENNSSFNIQPSTSSTYIINIQNSYNPSPSAPIENFSFNDMPPSYQEALANESIDGDTDDGINFEMEFNPLYPVYNLTNYGISSSVSQATHVNQPPKY